MQLTATIEFRISGLVVGERKAKGNLIQQNINHLLSRFEVLVGEKVIPGFKNNTFEKVKKFKFFFVHHYF